MPVTARGAARLALALAAGCNGDGLSNQRGDALLTPPLDLWVAAAAMATDLVVGPDLASPTAGMVIVPAGPFMMGCNATVDTQCRDDERPYHQIALAPFAIDITEVTQAAYDRCIKAGICATPQPTSGDFDPVGRPDFAVWIWDWNNATAFCAWVGKRLPTEAEWEKAARGTDGRVFPWGNQYPDCTLTDFDQCYGGPIPVGRLPAGASPYGALDMGGGVAEWVSDYYGATYYQTSPPANPTGPASGSEHVFRGGSYADFEAAMRTSNRNNRPDIRGPTGFRCARTL